MSLPTCWKCGYDLSGLRVDDLCPECGTPVWLERPPEVAYEIAQKAQFWGFLSLILMFACLGPFAAFLAWVALRDAAEAERLSRVGSAGRLAPSGIRTARICAWISICFSVATVVLWGIIIAPMIRW